MDALTVLKKYSRTPAFFTVLALIGVLVPFPLFIRTILALIYFIGMGTVIGNRLNPDESWPWRTHLGVWSYFAVITVAGAAMYWIAKLDLAVTALLLGAPPILLTIWKRPASHTHLFGHPGHEKQPDNPWHTLAGWLLAGISLAFCWYAASILFGAGTTESLRTPWDAVPALFFPVIGVAAALAITLALSGLGGGVAILPLTALAATAVLAAVAVYRVGFGFDPFIHQTTEQAIFAHGLMTPKTLYYIGQYASVTAIARMLGGHIVGVDRFLVPLAFAAVLPLAYWSLHRAFRWPAGQTAFASSVLLIFPLAPFIMTTPQGLADVFALAAFFLALPVIGGSQIANRESPSIISESRFANRDLPLTAPWPALLMCAAAAAVHPLAGVPLAFFAAALLFLRAAHGWEPKARRIGLAVLTCIGALTVPALFIINSRLSSGAAVAVDASVISDPTALVAALANEAVNARRFIPQLDFAYTWQGLRGWLLTATGLIGLTLLLRRSRSGQTGAYVAAAAVFAADYALLRAVLRFDFLVSSERTFYADRMLDLFLIALAPAVCVAAGMLAARLMKRPAVLRVALVAVLACTITASVYLAYPRRDKYESSRGWSTSGADVEAVRLIDRDAAGAPYIVLANQSVSAAAIRELGFKKYFTSQDAARPGSIFFYPVPTGGPLYAGFEAMNAAFGARTEAEQAMALTGAPVAYFVVNHYWSQGQKIIINASREADKNWIIGDGTDFVFKYVKR